MSAQREVDSFNAAYPEGTIVRYWRGVHAGEPSGTGPTRSPAYVSDAGHPVIFITGCSGYVALSHVEFAAVPETK